MAANQVIEGEVVTDRDDWRSYEGVLTRRMLAFCLDYILIFLLCIPFGAVVAVLGLLTFGLGFALFGILFPAVALLYVAATLGGSRQSTVGMRAMGIRLERLDGRRVDPLLAVVHTVLFWAANAILTPLILLATLVFDRKRTVHDKLLGTVVVRTPY